MDCLNPPRLAAWCLVALMAPYCLAQQGDGTRASASVHVVKPAKVGATPERMQALRVPPGFTIAPFATGLLNPRILAVAEDGRVYVSRREQGDVVMLHDTDGDGRADGAPVIVAHRPQAHGLAIRDKRLYLVTVKELFVADIQADGRLSPLRLLAGDLPDGRQHPNRTIAFGPDGMLYLSAGSTCNACNETNPESATLLRVSPDGESRSIFASGLRNTIGFDWHPATGQLWGMDHGIDYLGDTIQAEELNLLESGKQYGWPHIWGAGDENPQSTPPGEITKTQWRALSEPMKLGYTAHAAPMQMLFYRGGTFPVEYDGNAFVAMRGSWNRNQPSGYEVVRVRFGSDGQPSGFESFVTGFVASDGSTHMARPVGLAQARDGALLVADDGNGVIYRIASTAPTAGRKAPAPPAGPMLRQAAAGVGVPLASERDATKAEGRLEVRSSMVQPLEPIPAKYSEYAEGLSPPLTWDHLPRAKSYAIIMEDPDAKPTTPYVHWLAWNIPAPMTSLPEGLPEQARLTHPDGLLQGRTSRGSVGYYGPRPPVGDLPHTYHFQVFALDALLDVAPGADREALLSAMQGHVLAKGTLAGRYQQTVAPPK